MLWFTDLEDLKFPVNPVLDYPHIFWFDCRSSLFCSRIYLVLGNSFVQGHLYNVHSLDFVEGAYLTERRSHRAQPVTSEAQRVGSPFHGLGELEEGHFKEHSHWVCTWARQLLW